MKCHKIEKKLSGYQDGELSAAEKEQVERHLAGCLACRERHVKLQRAWEALGELTEIRPEHGFYDRLSSKIREAPEQRGFGALGWGNWRFRALMNPLAASILLVVGILWGVFIGNSFVKLNPPQSAAAHDEAGFLSSLRVFSAVPPGSLADNYERLLSYNEGPIR